MAAIDFPDPLQKGVDQGVVPVNPGNHPARRARQAVHDEMALFRIRSGQAVASCGFVRHAQDRLAAEFPELVMQRRKRRAMRPCLRVPVSRQRCVMIRQMSGMGEADQLLQADGLALSPCLQEMAADGPG